MSKDAPIQPTSLEQQLNQILEQGRTALAMQQARGNEFARTAFEGTIANLLAIIVTQQQEINTKKQLLEEALRKLQKFEGKAS